MNEGCGCSAYYTCRTHSNAKREDGALRIKRMRIAELEGDLEEAKLRIKTLEADLREERMRRAQ